MKNPQPKDNKKRNIIIIVIVVAVLLCCLVVVVVVAGGGAAYFLSGSSKATATPVAQVNLPPATSLPEDTATPEDTLAPEDTATPENIEAATDTPEVENAANPLGLGVTRDEMEQYLGAGSVFTFGKPFQFQGLEAVMGTDSNLCVKGDCAAATLAGPADDLLMVSVVVPTDPNDKIETATACALLMNVTVRFTQNSDIPMQILNAVTQAQSDQHDFNQSVTDNGYEFTILFNAKTNDAGLAVGRPRPQ